MTSKEDIILVSVNGIGLGHIARTTNIINLLLSMGGNIVLTTFGDAVNYVKNKFDKYKHIKMYELPSYDFSWTITGLEQNKTIINSMFNITPVILKQILIEKRIISKFSPKLIISDSMFSTQFLAWKYKIPSITVTNQLYIILNNSSLLRKSFSLLIKRFMPKIWFVSQEVLIPDMPPPYTISLRNIIDVPKSKLNKCTFVGLIDNYEKYVLNNFSEIYDVYIAISGPLIDKLNFYLNILKIIPMISKRYSIVVSSGNYRSNYVISKNNYKIFSWVKNKLNIAKRSKLIILRGGLTSILEAILLRKPMIIIPAMGQTEQIGNAWSVERLRIGKYIDYLQMLRSPRILEDVICHILDNYNIYQENINKVRNVLLHTGGLEYIKKILMKYIS